MTELIFEQIILRVQELLGEREKLKKKVSIRMCCVVETINVISILLHFRNEVSEKDTRIVGGEKAPRPYPYQISLQVKVPTYIAFFPTGRSEYMHNCGGSIVSVSKILMRSSMFLKKIMVFTHCSVGNVRTHSCSLCR